ncbi:Gfo/Idh/MocA family protein [Parenemella sanctibonifatiensis]|uniref:Gfo/Idh/MocA family oxidoreductase n=1 Tax=Parenemella sanctibonifatiensis TaxID=2016505 RepID=A0A255EDQ3_9ACTN|nr:Gfo/Idh/MocA family oxidoreductase [Parenemella sanctibonifatiensis]OYN87665.1 hypothetical protein CGZ92_08195 [Parenemella sanctibonifatiensis]
MVNDAPEVAPIRVAVAGLGRSGWGLHIQPLLQLPELYQVVAVHDAWPERATQVAADTGARAVDTFEDLLADDVDLVVVATPSHLHQPQALAAVRAGKHAVVEKPFAQDTASGEEVLTEAERRGTIVAAFQNHRFFPAIARARQLIAEGAIGQLLRLQIVNANFMQSVDWQAWQELGGGQLNNWGSHFLDFALAFAPGVEVIASHRAHTPLSGGDAEDLVYAALRSPEGTLVTIEITPADAYGQERLRAAGSQGTLVVDGSTVRWRTTDAGEPPTARREPTPTRGYDRPELDFSDHSEDHSDGPGPSETYYRALHEAIRHGAEPPVTPQQIGGLLAALAACRDGELVQP